MRQNFLLSGKNQRSGQPKSQPAAFIEENYISGIGLTRAGAFCGPTLGEQAGGLYGKLSASNVNGLQSKADVAAIMFQPRSAGRFY